jgi:crotonobetainyl-CoA:carnitine CoA-transferase CaiB-like acyl-CoA transferase
MRNGISRIFVVARSGGVMSQGPLSGVRVIDLTIAAAGPYATAILASQGADVIKIERPQGGDMMRGQGTVWKGVASTFIAWNLGKRSVAIDLQKPGGVDVVKRLVATADLFVHNLRLGNAEKLGLGYEDLRKIRGDLVYAYLTGWGETGPRASEPAYDSVVQAAAGFAAVQADPKSGEPQFVRTAICDKTSGVVLSQLLTSALLSRARTGKGQRVHVSMLHAALSWLWPDGMNATAFLDRVDDGGAKPTPPPVRRTKDGWMSLSGNLDREFQAICKLLKLEHLTRDPRLANQAERSRNGALLAAALDPVLASHSTAELVEMFSAHRIPHAVVNTRESIVDDPQVVAIGALQISQHADAGRTRVPRPVGDFSGTPLGTPTPAPRLGEHTDEVLRSIGVSDAELASLRTAGAIA